MKNKRFPNYPDDTDYTTNAPSYYEDLARKEKLIRLLSERIWGYENVLDDTLEEIQERFRAWDKNLEDLPEDVKVLLQQWLDNGTLDHIINETIFNWKLDTTIFEQFRDATTDQLQQLEQQTTDYFINIKKNGAIDGGDITTALQLSIDECSNNGGGIVYIPSGIYTISDTIQMKSRVRVVGANSDQSVYRYNQNFNGVFATEIKLADVTNKDMIVFGATCFSSSLERVFLNGNRQKQISGRGVVFDDAGDNRTRNRIEKVVISFVCDEGIYNHKNHYEIEILSSLVFWSGKADKAGIYIGGQDNVLDSVMSGYNDGNGIEITYGGALRAVNIDSFGNHGNGLDIHDVMTLSFIKATVNGNRKNDVKIYSSVDGYTPSKIYFVNSSFFNCGTGYSEILYGDGHGQHSPNATSFVNCMIGSMVRTTQAKYLFENIYPTKFESSFVNCIFNKNNYDDIFNTKNLNTLVGCVDNTGATVDSYNRLIKQRYDVDLETIGFDYKASDSVINKNKRLTTINTTNGNVTVTLPKANTTLPGQEVIIRKHDSSANSVIIIPATDDILNSNLSTINTQHKALRFITDGITNWFSVD